LKEDEQPDLLLRGLIVWIELLFQNDRLAAAHILLLVVIIIEIACQEKNNNNDHEQLTGAIIIKDCIRCEDVTMKWARSTMRKGRKKWRGLAKVWKRKCQQIRRKGEATKTKQQLYLPFPEVQLDDYCQTSTPYSEAPSRREVLTATSACHRG